MLFRSVPLIVHWPSKARASYTHWSSHLDIAPTLLHDLFGCSNEVSDYSVGQNLFTPTKRQFLLMANYSKYGIVEENRITTFDPHGGLEVTDSKLEPLTNSNPSSEVISQAMEWQRRFLR